MDIKEQSVQGLLAKFSEELKRHQYPISNMQCLLAKGSELETFALSQGVEEYTVELGQQFLSSFYPVSGKFASYADVDLQTKNAYWAIGMITDLYLHGIFTTTRRARTLPLSEKEESLLLNFQKFQIERGYARTSAKRCAYSIRVFLNYLTSHKIELKDIGEKEMVGFLSAYIDKSKQYLCNQIFALKRFSIFLFETGKTDASIAKYIPSVNKMANPHVPSVWKEDDLTKLLESVDRGNPLGKRDYAILLLAAKLGLRASDIKGLKFHQINWESHRIDIIQRKTQKPLSLPLPNDVGWAIIDYVRNGRPKCEAPEIFIRHVTPIGPFSESSSLHNIISRYRVIAGIELNDNVRKGMHSIRHTFATKLLREGIPLETIAEMLGHVGMSSVDIYLNVDTEELRRCALNPEEVYYDKCLSK